MKKSRAAGITAIDRRLVEEKRDWDALMHRWLRSASFSGGAGETLGDVGARLAALETRIEEAFAQLGEDEISEAEYENFFQRLGNYRGLAEAAGDFARAAAVMDWPRWRETRF